MISCRPYHPQSQGKVERSHPVLRQKINFDMIMKKKHGVNWAKEIPTYMKRLNNDKPEELGWKSPFDIYYGRKSNELLNADIRIEDESVSKAVLMTLSRRMKKPSLGERKLGKPWIDSTKG